MTIAIFVKVHLVQDVFRTVHYIVAIVFQVSATFKSDVKNLEIRVKRTDLDKVCGSGTCKLAHDIYFLLFLVPNKTKTARSRVYKHESVIRKHWKECPTCNHSNFFYYLWNYFNSYASSLLNICQKVDSLEEKNRFFFYERNYHSKN